MSRDLPEIDPAPSVSFSAAERFGAAWQSETIRTDAWDHEKGVRDQVRQELMQQLPEESREAVRLSFMQAGNPALLERAETALFDALNADPEPVQGPGLPRSREDLTAEVNRRRLADLREAETVLGLDGGGLAGFAGGFARAATDPVSLMMMPIGVGGGPLVTVASEVALGALGEAGVLPREFQVARELGLDDPNALARIGIGAGLGGIVGGAAAALGRAAEYRGAARQTDRIPSSGRPEDQEAAIAEARVRLESPPDRADAAPAPPAASAFNYRRGGNASPYTNRVGYVYGKLLELGYEPHVAAGLVGNVMQESGPRIATDAVGDNGNAFGMAQWNGPRRHEYLAFAQARGASPSDLDTQIAFLHHELTTSEAAAGAAIRAARTAEDAALIASREFWRPGVPHNERRAAYAADVFGQYETGTVPRWRSSAADIPEGSFGPTSRGYTGARQVSAGDDFRIEVAYEVMDASALRQASGDLQPRDRSRAASDEQVAEIAARLDPARLMPSPEADRGAPVIGPDNVVESGNGRVLAIRRAAEKHPDRFDAYRQAITDAGFAVPDGVETPVLVARRQTPLDGAERQSFVRAANSATVARMSATERAAADARAMTDDVVRLYVPGEALGGRANRPFTQRMLAALPQAERNGLVTADGALNAEGQQRIRQALFARAFDAPDILARFTETDAGDLRSLLEALDTAAPEWAALRADIAAGAVRPEMDITPFVMDAMRLIAQARAIAKSQDASVAAMVDELLAQVDLLEGAVDPLTVALVRKFWPNGKAARASDVGEFLKRYAVEARKAGRSDPGLFGDAPGPVAVLRALDAATFGDVPERAARQVETPPKAAPDAPLAASAYRDGASSPEAVEAAQAGAEALREAETTDGPFGPVHRDLRDQPEAAIARLMRDKTGEVPDAFVRDDIGDIGLVYGTRKMGLRHIEKKHPDVLPQLTDIVRKGQIVERQPDRIVLAAPGDPPLLAVVRLTFDEMDKVWLITAYDVTRSQSAEKLARQLRTSDLQLQSASSPPDATGPAKDNASRVSDQAADEIARLRAEAADFEFTDDSGVTRRLGDYLDELDRDADLTALIDACTLKGRS